MWVSTRLFFIALLLMSEACHVWAGSDTEDEASGSGSENAETTVPGSTASAGKASTTTEISTGEGSTNTDETGVSSSFFVPSDCQRLFATDEELFEPCRIEGWGVGGVIHSQSILDGLAGRKCISGGVELGEVGRSVDLSPLSEVEVICGSLSIASFPSEIQALNLDALKNVRAVSNTTTLYGWDIAEFDALERLEVTSKLAINGFGQLRSLKKLSSLREVNELRISNCPELESVGGLGTISHLRKLSLFNLPKIASLTALGSELAYLEELHLAELPRLLNLNDFANLNTIESLTLHDMESLTGLNGLESLKYLSSLWVARLPKLESFMALSSLESSLGSLRLEELPKLNSLEPLRANAEMLQLKLIDTPQISSLNAMEGVVQLENLTLGSSLPAANAFDLQGLRNLRRVTVEMNIHGISNIVSLTGLENLVHVEDLSLLSLDALNDISALAKLSLVERLRFGALPELELATAQVLVDGLGSFVNAKIAGCKDQTRLPMLDCPWIEDGDCDEYWSASNLGGVNVCIDDNRDCGIIQE